MLKQDSISGIRNIMIQIVTLLSLILSKMFFWRRKQRIWLIACGGERWGDNADVFWCYMNREHPEIRTIAIVKNKSVINPKKKNWIERNKLSTYILIMHAEVLATTHNLSDIGPESVLSLTKAKKVRLQHGVIAIGKINVDQTKSGHYDLICASSEKEKKLMTGKIGIEPEVIAVTGLARHDHLKENIKKGSAKTREGILFIPTSRAWFTSDQKEKYESLLFSWVNSLIDCDLKIKIWLHPKWYKNNSKLLVSSFTNVQNFTLEDDLQQLMCKSKLFITDYSSTFFDAALSGIPTIFYQPDRSEYIDKKGLFKEFLDQDLLLVVENKKDLLKQIDKILNDGEYYDQRLEKDQQWAYGYVKTFDGNSCHRIYQQIMQMLESEK